MVLLLPLAHALFYLSFERIISCCFFRIEIISIAHPATPSKLIPWELQIISAKFRTVIHVNYMTTLIL
jgi:hypothetical protein